MEERKRWKEMVHWAKGIAKEKPHVPSDASGKKEAAGPKKIMVPTDFSSDHTE